jgi:hypothetical protein
LIVFSKTSVDAYYAADPQLVEVVPSASQGKIVRSFIVPNVHTKGFRAVIDVQLDPANRRICAPSCGPARGRSPRPGPFRGAPSKRRGSCAIALRDSLSGFLGVKG